MDMRHCDGSADCQATEHIEGCFATMGPNWKRVTAAEAARAVVLQRQLEGAVDALRDLVGNSGHLCDHPLVKKPCAKCRAEAYLASLDRLGGQ